MDILVIILILMMTASGIPKINYMIKIRRMRTDRIKLAKKFQSKYEFLHDPIENDGLYSGIWRKANDEVDEMLKDEKKGRGFCHRRWNILKNHLKWKYGVEWFSPSEMNPDTKFD